MMQKRGEISLEADDEKLIEIAAAQIDQLIARSNISKKVTIEINWGR